MKKITFFLLSWVMVSAVFTGCGNQTAAPEETSQKTAIGNPWSNWTSIEEAENHIGFQFGLPEVIAERYHASAIRTLNKDLIEVIYRDESFEVCVRKQKGEGQDISGDYNKYEVCTETEQNGAVIISFHNTNHAAVKQLISFKGYSWSLVAPNGYWGDSNWDFMRKIWEQ